MQSTIHLGLFYKKELVGIATFLKNSHSRFDEKSQYQLRGMAILSEFQGKGFGFQLLFKGEELLKNKTERIWFNARKIAVNFYKKHGYKIIGNAFEIPNIGTHFVMSK